MILHALSFALLILLTYPLRFFSYPLIHRLGNALGPLAFYALPKFRKRTLSNLALALDLPKKELLRIAKASMGNLLITCLEYPKFASKKEIHNVARCENPKEAQALIEQGKGVIFFCGHQANWEVLFLEGTRRMPGVAIGRPVKNHFLYHWVLKIRQKYGGIIVTPKMAVKEGLRGLKQGKFLGIVGDQGMPDSGYSSPFLGRRAWTSPLPALLSYRTGAPIFVATTVRKEGRYQIHYSEPLWPCQELPMEGEIDRLMRAALALFEESVRQIPEQWLWSHNRWKQQTPEKIRRPFRQDCLCIIFPENKEECEALLPHLATFRQIYPTEWITLKVPPHLNHPDVDMEIQAYKDEKELLSEDYRFKLVFNFSDYKRVKSHFLALAASVVIDKKGLQKLSCMPRTTPLSTLLKGALLHAP